MLNYIHQSLDGKQITGNSASYFMEADRKNLQLIRTVREKAKNDKMSLGDALNAVRGDHAQPSEAKFKEWNELVASVEQEFGVPWRDWMLQFFVSIKAFVSSGFFFILVGLCFLFFADWTQNRTHATFTFVYVVMGVAITLYGTGTQAIGNLSGEAGPDWKVQSSLVGGAGALAFLVGLAVVYGSPGMRKAFKPQTSYYRVVVKAQSVNGDKFYHPTDFSISAKGDNGTLYVGNDSDNFAILLPVYSGSKRCHFPIDIELRHKADDHSIKDKFVFSLIETGCGEPKKPIGALAAVDSAGVDFAKYKTELRFNDSKIYPQPINVLFKGTVIEPSRTPNLASELKNETDLGWN